MKNIKVYKNQNRNIKETYEAPVPQYQSLGVEPIEYKSSIVPPNTPVIKPNEAANRNRQPAVRQEVVQAYPVVLPDIKNTAPTWSSLDGDIVDDVFENQENNQIIDNNDFYTDKAFGYQSDGDQLSSNDLLSVVNELDTDSYLLLVRGEPICSGPLQEIEEQTKTLIFGDHELSGGEPMPEEDLIVLKKVKIKVGVFLG